MICVSIGRGRHRQMIAEFKHLVSKGAQLVELRLDYINGEVNLKRLLAEKPCPVIITCRRASDGGRWSKDEESRQVLLRTAIVHGVDYVDLEDDIAGSIPRFGATKRIVSHHDFRKTPENLSELHARLAGLNADIVKITTMANTPHDNIRILRMVKESTIPTIGMCMGDIGTPSRILSGRFGSPFTYSTFNHERVLAPGQLSFQQMQEIYHYDQINQETEIYGVIGDPIGHSLSPQIHNAAFRKAGRNAVYLPFRIPAENLEQFIADAPEWGLKGLSVTIPHKEAVIRSLTKVDPAVKGVGAANTVLFQGGERLGYNTDYRAAMDSLQRAMGLNEGEEASLAGKIGLVLGAGGAARAIAYGLKRRGAQVIITSRTAARAQALAERLQCNAIDWAERHKPEADIIINCTPIGMHPNVDESPYEKQNLAASMVVFDTVYNPENTLLIKEARNRGCTVVSGVEMFVRQASLQFKLFTGEESPWELMRDVLKRTIGPAKL